MLKKETETRTLQTLAQEFIISKNEKIFKEIIDRLTPGLTTFARKFTSDEDVVKDIVEQTFIAVWGKIELYKQEYQFSTWVYAIAKNEALSHLNFKKRNLSHDQLSEAHSKTLSNMSPIEYPEYEVMLPTGEHLIKFLYDTSVSLIEELPEPYRSIIYEKDVKCEQLQTIAEKFDCNLSTVKTRLRKARQDIALMMKEKYPLIVNFYLSHETI